MFRSKNPKRIPKSVTVRTTPTTILQSKGAFTSVTLNVLLSDPSELVKLHVNSSPLFLLKSTGTTLNERLVLEPFTLTLESPIRDPCHT